MEKTQMLMESSNFDTKKMINRSDKIISKDYLEILENEGATTELLDTLGVPVFKYKTQITIHGLFPVLQNNYILGYKNLFQNKNLSIGVKYNAIDAKKKEQIYKYLKYHGWGVYHTSQEYFAYRAVAVEKENYVDEVTKMKELISLIDTSLFYGGTSVYLAKTMFNNFVVGRIDISAIPAPNVEKLVLNITGIPLSENARLIKEKEDKEEAEWNERKAQREQYAREKLSRTTPHIVEAKQKLVDAGYVFTSKHELIMDTVVLSVYCEEEENEDGTFSHEVKYVWKRYTRSGAQKFFRCVSAETDSLENDPYYSSYTTQLKGKFVTGYIIPQVHQIVNEEPVPVHEMPKVVIGRVTVLDYSPKVIAVAGETKEIKDTLKELGGKFNLRLRCGPGWIFSITRKNEIINALQILNSLR